MRRAAAIARLRPWLSRDRTRAACVRRAWLRLAISFAGALACFGAAAHESRPGYLALNEIAPGQYEALWKQPASGEYTLRLRPIFPAECMVEGGPNGVLVAGALLSRFQLECPGGLAGKTIVIDGLQATLTDVLIRVSDRSGHEETHLARSTDPRVTLGGGDDGLSRVATYLRLGVQHILMGADHLLFVLGLLLIVRDRWTLLKTVTAFTVAHSIALAAATLGLVRVPAAPLNAAIALSILFLAPEIIRARSGRTSLTIRRPWLVAFAFGLLHGLGFASGLAAMGLPRAEIPLALLLFNCGIEIGQLAFVVLVLGLIRAFRLMEIKWPRPIAALPAYGVGVLGAFWTLQRLVIFIGGAA